MVAIIILPQVFCGKESLLRNRSLEKLSPRRKQIVGSYFPVQAKLFSHTARTRDKMSVCNSGGPMARFEVSVSLGAAISSEGWEMRDTAAMEVVYQAELGQNIDLDLRKAILHQLIAGTFRRRPFLLRMERTKVELSSIHPKPFRNRKLVFQEDLCLSSTHIMLPFAIYLLTSNLCQTTCCAALVFGEECAF